MVILGEWVFLMSEVPLYPHVETLCERYKPDNVRTGLQPVLVGLYKYRGTSLIRNTHSLRISIGP